MKVKIRFDHEDDELDEHPAGRTLELRSVTALQGEQILRILYPGRLVTTLRAFMDETLRLGVR